MLLRNLNTFWGQAGAWPELIDAMRLAILPPGTGATNEPGKSSRWATLPSRCCRAAGGQEGWAEPVTTAWLLFYAAADIMDSVQDGDPPAGWWATHGPGTALSVASGLYFTASGMLNELFRRPETKPVALEISDEFFATFLQMCSGQQGEIVRQPLDLENFWEIAGAKSGAFFGLGCRAGARLGMASPTSLQAYGAYGHHLGLLVQIGDELEEVRSPGGGHVAGQQPGFANSLPVVYAREVLPTVERKRLETCLHSAPKDPAAALEAISLLDKAGAAAYLELMLLRHRQAALEALSQANPDPQASAELEQMLENL